VRVHGHLSYQNTEGAIRLSLQICQQRLGLLQVGGVKALGEPAVDRREDLARFVALALLPPQPAQARRRPELLGFNLTFPLWCFNRISCWLQRNTP
jgi:hypothetical protein